MSEECWVIGDCQQMRQDLTHLLEERAKQIGFRFDGNKCLLCLKSLLHNRHTVEECLEDHSRKLIDPLVQSVPQNEVTWKIYEGDIEVTQTWSKLASGLKQCGFCDHKQLLHYPKECLKEGPTGHSCVFCGKEEPDHIPEDCCKKDKESEARDIDELFYQCIQFQRTLLYQGICYIYQMSDIPDGHVGKCLGAKIVPADKGWAPPWVRVDTVVGSGLPVCSYCGQARPLYYPGDCNWALYEADWMPGLVCGSDSHIQEECPIPGTSVVGCVTLPDMINAHLTKYQNTGQCYFCKSYQLIGGKYGKRHFTSKKCIYSLLARGSLKWDREESLLQ